MIEKWYAVAYEGTGTIVGDTRGRRFIYGTRDEARNDIENMISEWRATEITTIPSVVVEPKFKVIEIGIDSKSRRRTIK